MITEVWNVLIEQKSAGSGCVSMQKIYHHIVSTGPHPLISRFLWPFVKIAYEPHGKVKYYIERTSKVLVLGRNMGTTLEVMWKWAGTDGVIRSCSRRPFLGKVAAAE